ncbi:neurofilament medium polypeptide-like isoform X2 [Macrobrachium rosenbergii]|uniref:neurofilament medium polypeptide-like isoform X2 n=1 Tax=Macrobrachium rosenbergii TaxID=79674 RepID=UPI0034D4C65C
MRTIFTLTLLLTLVALAMPMPKACRGRGCRHLRPAHTTGRNRAPQVAPGNKLPLGAVRRPIAKRPPVPAVKVAVTTAPAVPEVEQVTEMKMVTDADGKEVREAGVNGWLSEPTPAPDNTPSISRTEPPSKNDKHGSCDTPKGFGIKCAVRFDQCTSDGDCPGTTKCCMVGDCGYLCVKPKPVSTGPKEVTKEVPNKKIKGDKVSSQGVADLTPSSSEVTEAVELPEGAVKLEDIIELPEEMKKKMAEEQAKKEEERKKQELAGEKQPEEEKLMEEKPEETKKEETSSQAEKVTEKLEEFVEEEVSLIEEELESTTELPLQEEGEEEGKETATEE